MKRITEEWEQIPLFNTYIGGNNLASIEEKVESLIIDKINDLGYELYDIHYVKEGKDYFLRIFIDKPEGINLNDCEKVNNAINDLLDEADYIKDQYFLEISSPGIERILRKDKHLEDNIDSLVEVKLFKPIEKQKVLQGILKQYNKEKIIIEVEEKNIEIFRKDISVIKTVYEW